MSLPADSTARKRIPMFSGLLAYFPDALAAVAQLSFDGNEKHNPGEPLHWSREKSSDHLDCCVRHLTDIATGADKIEELKALAWRALAELQLTLEDAAKKPSEDDDWIEWTACANSKAPVLGMNVDVRLRDGTIISDSLAENFAWFDCGSLSISAYRVSKSGEPKPG